MTTEKKVTFSAVIKTVTNQGEIRYEPDALSPSNQPVEDDRFESFDFLQHHFEELFPFGGDEYEDHVNMLSMPFFRCSNVEVKKIGAVDFLKALAQNPPNVASGDSTHGPTIPAVPVSLAVEPAKKKTDQKESKKRGVIVPKEIPGRDTPEQRKLRLVGAGKIQVSAAKTSTQGISSDKLKHPKSIMKVTTNEYDDVIVTHSKEKPRTRVPCAANATDSAGPNVVADGESSKQASGDSDERVQPDTSESPTGLSTNEIPDSPEILRRHDRYSPISREDPIIKNKSVQAMPSLFQSSKSDVKEIVAVDSPKAIDKYPPNVAAAASINGPSITDASVSLAVELPRKDMDQDSKRRGVVLPKGFDTPEQCKLRLMDSGKIRGSVAKTCTQGISSDQPEQSKLTMKATTNGHHDTAVTHSKSRPMTVIVSSPATSPDHAGTRLEAQNKSKEDHQESEEREQPDTCDPPTVSSSIKDMPGSTKIKRRLNRYSPIAREDPPSAQELLGGPATRSAMSVADDDDFRPKGSPSHQRKPDPSALYSSEDMYRPGSMPSMASRPTVLTRRPNRTLPAE